MNTRKRFSDWIHARWNTWMYGIAVIAPPASDIPRHKRAGAQGNVCSDCAKMDWKNLWCRHLNNQISSGYAMAAHSKVCGGYVPVKEERT